MKQHQVILPSVRTAIVPVRERIRNGLRPVDENDLVGFVYDAAEESQPYRNLIEEFGLQFVRADRGTLWFKRPGRIERWEYAFPMVGLNPAEFPPSWKCLDVGCGRKPWPRANVVLDANPDMAAHAGNEQKFFSGTVTEKMPFETKEFDFVTCFHVLEHVSDPVAAAAELSRVAKEGLVEVPHPIKDGMLLFHETDHRWFILPPTKPDGPLIFRKIDNDWWARLQDPEAQAAAYRNYIGTKDNVGDAAILRNYFSRIEPLLNIVVHWKGELKVTVIQ